MVYVLDQEGNSLQPTNRHGKVRRLLKNNKAKVVDKNPFTIQLLYEPKTKETQLVKVYFDTGGKYQGFALISNGKVLYKGTIELRDGVAKLIKQRQSYRRSRRTRKTRYRECRFNNRKREKGWLPPSVSSKYNHILNWIDRLTRYLPNFELTVEIANFDIQKLKNPEIEGKEYQEGELYGYENTKQYLIFREKAKCQLCGKEKGNDTWSLHHLYKSKDCGTDSPDNLALLHRKCHDKLHNNDLDDKLEENAKKLAEQKSKVRQFKYTIFMNIIKNRLCKDLKSNYSDRVNFTYGYITKVNRYNLGLEKTHYNDCLAMHNKEVKDNIKPIYIKQVRKKKRSLHEAIPRAGRGDKVNRTQKRSSKNTKQVVKSDKLWCLYDKVYIPELKEYGFITGFTGKWVYVQDIEGKYLKLPDKSYKQMNPNNIELVKRNNNWISKVV